MPVLGIDLGRASCSAYVRFVGNDTEDDFVFHVEPVLALTAKDEWLVGDDARRAAATGGGEAVWDLLQLQGRKIGDFTATQLASWPFRLVHGASGKALVEFQAKPSLSRTVFAPEELLAVLFARVRQVVERRAGCCIEECVLTVPTNYTYTQRQAMRDACAMAGLSARRLIVCSTAAGLAHTQARGEAATGELVLVVDVGAGSVDVALVSAMQGGSIEVKAVAGDSAVGGAMLTDRIVAHFLRDLAVQAAVSTTMALNRLRRASQLAKKILSTSTVASVQLQLDSTAFTGTITRAEFEAGCSDCWDRIAELVQIVLSEGHTAAEQVNHVLLCGGSAVVPAVGTLFQRLFPTAVMEVDSNSDAQARGAALVAASLLDETRSPMLLDVTPLAYGVQRIGTKDVAIVIPANARVPASGDNIFFVGSHVLELAYHVLEGRHLRRAVFTPHNAHTATQPAHVIGTIRSLQTPPALTVAPKPVVTKITITFDLSADLELTASIADFTTKHPTTERFRGDETVMPRDRIARARTELDQLFGGHRVVSPSHSVCNGIHTLPSRAAAINEHEQLCRAIRETKTLAVELSDDDARLLITKIEELLAWLQSTPSAASATGASASATTEAIDDETDEPLRVRLCALRRLRWSLAASSAVAQLRAHLDD